VLVLVLLSLVGFVIWSATLTERSATTVHASAAKSALIARAQYLVAWESSLQREYWVQSDSDADVRQRFDAAADRLVATLRGLQQLRDAHDDDGATYARLLALQGQYR